MTIFAVQYLVADNFLCILFKNSACTAHFWLAPVLYMINLYITMPDFVTLATMVGVWRLQV